MAFGLTPDHRVAGVSEVTPEFLRRIGARGVIADLDNTLARPDAPLPTPEGERWLASMREAGIPVVVVSNNSHPRVSGFCGPLGIPFVPRGGKPFGRGIGRALAVLGVGRGSAVVLGDQIFTDILAARVNRVACILTEPVGEDSGFLFALKRGLEKIISGKRGSKSV